MATPPSKGGAPVETTWGGRDNLLIFNTAASQTQIRHDFARAMVNAEFRGKSLSLARGGWFRDRRPAELRAARARVWTRGDA